MAERDDVNLAGYLGIAAAKHSALTAAACELGALAAGTNRNQVDHLRRFGDDIGLARKHVDDVLALHDDLVDGCRGLRLVAAAAGDGDGRTWCEQQAELLLARGLGHLRQAGPVEADELAGFARAVTRCRRTSPAGRALSYGRRTSFPAA